MAPSTSGEAPYTSTSKMPDSVGTVVSHELTMSMDTSMEFSFETPKSRNRFNWNSLKKGAEFIREYCEETEFSRTFQNKRNLFRR